MGVPPVDVIAPYQQEVQIRGLPDRLYRAIYAAEFRGLGTSDAFIRTMHTPEKGSSAYGPLQITHGLMESTSTLLSLTVDESDFVRRFLEQGEKFLTFGSEPDKLGYEERYDYGGSGDLASEHDKKLYEIVGKKIVMLIWAQSGGNLELFIDNWRYGGHKVTSVSDRDYYLTFKTTFWEQSE